MSRPAIASQIEALGWTVGKKLGEGAFGTVFHVTRKSDGVTAACKVILKPKDIKERQMIETEAKVRRLSLIHI